MGKILLVSIRICSRRGAKRGKRDSINTTPDLMNSFATVAA
jgi:hypothetical protein